MSDRRRALAVLVLPAPFLLLPILSAQEPANSGAGTRSPNDASVSAAAIAGSKEDPAAFQRGAALYTTYCSGCHGPNARGGPGAPDLVRSLVVLDDEKGLLIAPVLRNGRPDAGMPKLNLTEPQISDLVAWLHVQTWAADHRNTYAFKDVLTGNPQKGEAYFNANCAACHSADGDLKGIGARYDGFSLQARWLQPRGGRGGGGRGGRGGANAGSPRASITVTVTLPSGEKVSGTLDRIDDFSVSLRDSEGDYHSFTREGGVPKVEIHDPLKAHTELLAKYTDADIHNITAYLATLK
jgi:cytochrome c oxidase cbb3-type subunit III